MGWHDMDGTDWAWMTAMMVLFWGVVIAGGILLVRRTAPTTPRDTPEETLRHRLARGEIEKIAAGKSGTKSFDLPAGN